MENKSNLRFKCLDNQTEEIIDLASSRQSFKNFHLKLKQDSSVFIDLGEDVLAENKIEISLQNKKSLVVVNAKNSFKLDLKINGNKDSRLNLVFVSSANNANEQEIYTEINCNYSKLNFFAYGGEKSKITAKLYSMSTLKDSENQMLIRGVASDESKLKIFTSPIVEENANNSHAHLDIKSLMLGQKSSVSCIPGLLIKNHEIQSSHSLAIAAQNKKDVFFLESRCIDTERQRELFVESYLSEITKKISVESFAECVKDSHINSVQICKR